LFFGGEGFCNLSGNEVRASSRLPLHSSTRLPIGLFFERKGTALCRPLVYSRGNVRISVLRHLRFLSVWRASQCLSASLSCFFGSLLAVKSRSTFQGMRNRPVSRRWRWQRGQRYLTLAGSSDVQLRTTTAADLAVGRRRDGRCRQRRSRRGCCSLAPMRQA
jgi:hypothetical protein